MAELMDEHLFDEEDAFRLEQVMHPGTTVGVVLFEHLWAIPAAGRRDTRQGLELVNQWVRPEAVLAAGEPFALDVADEGVEPTDADIA